MFTTLILMGCGSGESNKVIVIDDSLLVLPQIGEPLPKGVIAYDKIASDVSGLQLIGDQSTGQTLLWQSVDSFSGMFPNYSINVSEYFSGEGWNSPETIKTNLLFSETRLLKDRLGDVHVSWWVPGREIGVRSKINDEWQPQKIFTNNGLCLEMDSQNIDVGPSLIWCGNNRLVNREGLDNNNWISKGEIGNSNIEKRRVNYSEIANDNYLLSWIPSGFDIDNQSDYGIRVGEYTSEGVALSDTKVVTFEDYHLPNNKLFSNKSDRHLLVWDDSTKPLINKLKVSLFDRIWSEETTLNSGSVGYTKFDNYFLSNKHAILLAHQFAMNGLEIYYYNGNLWSEISVIEDVTSFDAVVEENTLLLVYANELETKGIRIEAGTINDDIFKLEQKVNSIGVSNLGSNKLMTVWTLLGDAYYTIIEY